MDVEEVICEVDWKLAVNHVRRRVEYWICLKINDAVSCNEVNNNVHFNRLIN
jgi:hypothetical protein